MNVDLNGMVAVVTGSSAGIGYGIAEALARNGAKVVVTSRSSEKAEEIAKKINSISGADIMGVPFDLSNKGDAQAILEKTIGRFGHLDLLVNNAFDLNSLVQILKSDEDGLDAAITSNVTNVMNLTRLAHPHLIKRRGNASIINIASVIVNKHLLGLSVYAVIKGAIQQLTKALAAEWAADGIRVNAINPGFIRTEAYSSKGISAKVIEERYDYYKGYHPLGRVGEPQEIGALAVFLASKQSALITGGLIDVDGGYSIQGLPLYEQTNPEA
ncbi:SDR family NAD(P)-dependent oxidoreductase [Pseudomonadota bacterium]